MGAQNDARAAAFRIGGIEAAAALFVDGEIGTCPACEGRSLAPRPSMLTRSDGRDPAPNEFSTFLETRCSTCDGEGMMFKCPFGGPLVSYPRPGSLKFGA